MPTFPKYFKYFLLFIFFSFISTLLAIDPVNSIKDDKEFLVFLLIPIFLLVVNTPSRLKSTLAVVLASGLISAVFGFWIIIREGISLDHRLKGFTSHWMTYSGLLTLTFIFFFVFLFYQERKKIKFLMAGAEIILLAAIILSLTRAMWVGIAVSLVLFIIYYKPKILYIAVPILVILVLVLPPSVKNRVLSIVDMSNATNKDRFYMLDIGIRIFKDYPVLGVGPNNIEKIYDRYRPAEAEHSNPHLHNNFIHVLAERGILALLSLIAAFVSLILQLVGKIKKSPPDSMEKMISIAVLFTFIGFLVAGLFEYNFGDSEIKFLLFYFISIPFLNLGSEQFASVQNPPTPKEP